MPAERRLSAVIKTSKRVNHRGTEDTEKTERINAIVSSVFSVTLWLTLLFYYPFARLADHVVHDRLQVAGLLEHAHLPVGAVALFEDAERVLDLWARPQLVEHVTEEPFDQLPDQVAGRHLLLLAEVHELAV